MSFLLKVKRWVVKGAFLLAGILGGILGTVLWARMEEIKQDEQEEREDAEYHKRESFEEMEEISRKGREKVRSLSDAAFDERYPSVPRDAESGGNRFVDRCRSFLQSRGSQSDDRGDHDNSSGGD